MAEKLEARLVKATPRILNRLARVEPGDPVLSVFLDLDPNTFATAGARKSQVTSVLNEAEGKIEELGDEKKPLRDDVEAVRQFLDQDDEWPKDAGAVAVFRSGTRDMFEVIKLPDAVPSGAAIESTPYIEPIANIVSSGEWCVVLINRRVSRIFLGSPDWIRELGAVKDDVHGQHDQGGWSQSRYARSVENEVADHIAHTSDELMELAKKRIFRRLVIGVAPELWPEVEGKFHADLMRMISGQVELDIENASKEDVQRELEHVAAILENQEEKELLARLREALGTNGRGSSGLEDVLEDLSQSRVETLLVDDAFEATGVSCPNCGWAGASGTTCPLDGSELERGVDLVEKAIELTHSQSGEVRIIRYHNDLEGFGSIASLNRF
jgi:peptide chain release factor subunit 1